VTAGATGCTVGVGAAAQLPQLRSGGLSGACPGRRGCAKCATVQGQLKICGTFCLNALHMQQIGTRTPVSLATHLLRMLFSTTLIRLRLPLPLWPCCGVALRVFPVD